MNLKDLFNKQSASQKKGVISNKGPSAAKDANKKKWLMIGGGLISIVLVISLTSEKPQLNIKEEKEVIDLTPSNIDERSWQVQSQADISSLKDDVSELTTVVRELTTLTKEQQAIIAKQKQEIEEAKELADKANEIAQQKPKAPPAPKEVASEETQSDPSVVPPPPPLPKGAKVDSSVKTDNRAGGAVLETRSVSKPMVFKAPETTNTSNETEETAKVTTRYRKNEFAGYIPSSSFAQVSLLNGLDAGVSDFTRSNPQPITMRVTRDAILPGSAKYQLESCHVLGTAVGNLSSERVNIRLSRLSCIDKRNTLVIDEEIKGYVVDSDGVEGIRGKVIKRNGAALAKTTLAGFLSGISDVASNSQGTVTQSALGAVETLTNTDTLNQSALGGASSAAQMLAEYYMQEARNIFPIISVKPGRKATIILTDGVSLKWNDYGSLYIKETIPE